MEHTAQNEHDLKAFFKELRAQQPSEARLECDNTLTNPSLLRKRAFAAGYRIKTTSKPKSYVFKLLSTSEKAKRGSVSANALEYLESLPLGVQIDISACEFKRETLRAIAGAIGMRVSIRRDKIAEKWYLTAQKTQAHE